MSNKIDVNLLASDYFSMVLINAIGDVSEKTNTPLKDILGQSKDKLADPHIQIELNAVINGVQYNLDQKFIDCVNDVIERQWNDIQHNLDEYAMSLITEKSKKIIDLLNDLDLHYVGLQQALRELDEA